MREASYQKARLAPSDRSDGGWVVALRTLANPGAGNLWISEPGGGRQEALGGKAERARLQERHRRRYIGRRGGETLSSLAPRSDQGPTHLSALGNHVRCATGFLPIGPGLQSLRLPGRWKASSAKVPFRPKAIQQG